MDQQRTIWTIITAAAVVIVVVISAMAYQSTQSTSSVASDDVAIDVEPYRAFTIDLNLPPLSDGRYMIWAIDKANQYTLLKEFLVNSSLFITDLTGKPLPTTVSVPDYDLHQAVSFVVTVEKLEGTITVSSQSVVLETRANTGANYTLAFPHDMATVTGSFMLATPTNGPDTQETSGVWFSNPAALTLPPVPTGWIYAAWVAYDGIRLPVGAFTTPTAIDSTAQYSGPRSGFETPGEDFLTNARENDPALPLNLADGKAEIIVTLQPADLLITDGRPYYRIPLLRAPVAPSAEAHTAYDLEPLEVMPSGLIRIITR